MPYQSKIILTLMVTLIIVSAGLIITQYIIPVWRLASQAASSVLSFTSISDDNDNDISKWTVHVSLGETVTVMGTDIALTNETVSARKLSQPFDVLHIVTLSAKRGNETTEIYLSRSQPAGYSDQPTIIWNGYKFTLIKAEPLGAQSATIQVKAQS